MSPWASREDQGRRGEGGDLSEGKGKGRRGEEGVKRVEGMVMFVLGSEVRGKRAQVEREGSPVICVPFFSSNLERNLI